MGFQKTHRKVQGAMLMNGRWHWKSNLWPVKAGNALRPCTRAVHDEEIFGAE
jgi:hypothetical protein